MLSDCVINRSSQEYAHRLSVAVGRTRVWLGVGAALRNAGRSCRTRNKMAACTRQRCDLKEPWVRCGCETWGGEVWRCSRPKMGLVACSLPRKEPLTRLGPPTCAPAPSTSARNALRQQSFLGRAPAPTNCRSAHESLILRVKACSHVKIIFSVVAPFTHCSASSSSPQLLIPIPHSLDATICDSELLTDPTASRRYLTIPCLIRAYSQW